MNEETHFLFQSYIEVGLGGAARVVLHARVFGHFGEARVLLLLESALVGPVLELLPPRKHAVFAVPFFLMWLKGLSFEKAGN